MSHNLFMFIIDYKNSIKISYLCSCIVLASVIRPYLYNIVISFDGAAVRLVLQC